MLIQQNFHPRYQKKVHKSQQSRFARPFKYLAQIQKLDFLSQQKMTCCMQRPSPPYSDITCDAADVSIENGDDFICDDFNCDVSICDDFNCDDFNCDVFICDVFSDGKLLNSPGVIVRCSADSFATSLLMSSDNSGNGS